jgi:hypothetical protein
MSTKHTFSIFSLPKLTLNKKLFLIGFQFLDKFNSKMRKSSARIIKQRLHATIDKGSYETGLPVMNDTRSLYSMFRLAVEFEKQSNNEKGWLVRRLIMT